MEKTPHSQLIDALGGTSKTALMFDIDPASVSGWRKTGIPKARLMYIKLARPDLFDEAGSVIAAGDEAC
jgi:hypothetical protein